MKTRFTLLGILAMLIVSICAIFVSCNKELNDIINYSGQVVYLKTTTPFPNLAVKVTDGTNIHCQGFTDEGGMFSLKVKVNEINGNYYLLAGDSTCVPKKVAIGGYGQTEVDLGVIEVEGPSLPVVVTHTISSVTADAAVCGGEVTSAGRLKITARGVCYGTDVYPEVSGSHTKDGEGVGVFTSTLKDLAHNTIYYARAYATNSMGTSYGEQVKFTTEEGVAVVITDSVYRITANSARCKGHVDSDGGYQVTKRGTCWSKRPDPTIDDDRTDDGSGLGEFTSALKDLQENTKYYVRTYATNSTATVYGEQIIITTLDGLPVVTTDSVTAVTATGFTAHGTVVYDCDIDVTARGFCYATTQYPTTDNEHTTSGKGLGSFKSTISQLEYGTTYYIRAYAINATETTYGEQFTITTLSGLPTVTTADVTNIGSIKATCGGEVTDDGSLTVTARGVCYGKEQQPTIDDSHTTDGKGKGTFTSSIKGLEDKTTYYVRAYATTDAGTAYGEQKTFMTENGVPVVILSNLGEPTANSITCKGEVTGDGGVSLTERGFCYSTTQYPTNTDGHLAIGTGLGEFTGSLTGLAINTTYYVRAYAVNSLGIGYSEQQSFTTKNGLPVVTTGQATSTATTVTANGEVSDNGGYAVTERGVCYSTVNSEPTISDEKVAVGSGNGTFTASITGLNASTTYYIRAYATNSNGTAYGAAQTIQTKNGLAAVTTGTISGITALSAKGSVTVTDADGAILQSCGICWAVTPNPTTDNSTSVGGNQLNMAYTCNMTNLTPNTTYYVRAYATTDITTSYGEQVTFTTVSGLPVVTTGVPTATATSIVAQGEVTDNGGYNVTDRGFCYSATNSEPTMADTKIASGSGNGSYNASISMLTAATTYYVRTYATNSVGTSYGNVVSVTTKNGVATVSAGTITSITALSASGSVTVTDAGGATLQSCGICWGTTSNPTTDGSKIVAGGKQLNTTYSCSMTELSPNTTYYVRAYAITDIATAYSEQVTFKTVTGLPTVTTGTLTPTATTISANGEVTGNGGYTITERGFCYSATNAEPSLTDTKITSGSGNGSFSASIKTLKASTKYYVRAYATNSIGTSYGNIVSVTTKNGAASVTTGSIKNITALSASGSVTVTDAAGATLQSCGICWATIPNPTISNNKTAGGNQLSTLYNCNMTGLTPSTTYYVRAYATTDITTAYGEQVTFNTVSGLPAVATNPTTATSTTITSGGNISSDGGYSITARGVCYSTTNANPTIADKYVTNGSGTGSYSCTITGVSVSTTYYVRAYATNSIGTTYGNVETVVTGAGLPTVTTTIIGENVTSTTAVGGGQVVDDGGYNVTARGVCWATTPSPTINNNKTVDGAGKGYFTSNITGIDISGNNTYYVRAYATNANGTVYGSTVLVNKENLDYSNLPTFVYGGYTYRLYDDIGAMTIDAAHTACENLTYGGYDDWFLPSYEETHAAFYAIKEGWLLDPNDYMPYSDHVERWTKYWTSSESSSYYYYAYIIVSIYSSGNTFEILQQSFRGTAIYRVRPVRKYLTNQ